jgi:dipeptidyl aminopeptidase/acylaminoacyl peptidase
MDRGERDYRYDAFISYRRSDGSNLAVWLRHTLQDYVLPVGLSGNRKKLKIYLDTAYERANEDFWTNNIAPELERSRYLIVVITPSALQRRADGEKNWVDREIEFFLTLPQRRNILVAGAKGDLTELPGRLLEHFPHISIVDFRAFSPLVDRLYLRALLRQHVVKFLGTLHNIESQQMSELREEAARRARNRAAWLTTIIITAFALISGFAVTAIVQRNNARAATDRERIARLDSDRNAMEARTQSERAQANAEEARQQKNIAVVNEAEAKRQQGIAEESARESRARAFVAYANESLNEDPERSVLLAMEAVDTTVRLGGPPLPVAEDALHRAILASNLRMILRSHSGGFHAVVFSPDAKRLVTANEDGSATIWDAANGQELLVLRGHSGSVNAVAISLDNKYLATASKDKTAKIWDMASGKELLTLRGHSDSVNGVAISPDGTRLATASSDKTGKIWNVANGLELMTLRGHSGGVNAIAVSPDGKDVATASSDATAKIWDSATGKELLNLFEHTDSRGAVAFSPDGKRLATPGVQRTATIWEVSDGRPAQILQGNSDVIETLPSVQMVNVWLLVAWKVQ